MEHYPGRYPAVVASYSASTRTVRVSVPGITDGGDVMPVAEIEYPIGDKAKGGDASEIEILAGDTVWVCFIGGDPRFPLITGWRNPSVGNSVQWRRWHHANIQLRADGTINILAGGPVNITAQADVNVTSQVHATVKAPAITLDAAETNITGRLSVAGAISYAAGMSGSGGASITGGDVTADGISLKGHVHGGIQPGNGKTSGPS